MKAYVLGALADLFHDSEHVRNVGPKAGDDRLVWQYAATSGLIIVSKDSDFYRRSLLFGQPPKVVWIRRGNCSTRDIEALMRAYFDDIKDFNDDAQETFLVLL